MGVGPEQNFTYIAALKPSIAFIVDVRRGNLDLHLMYKALFELSADRVDFVSRLFARKRPEGLTSSSSVAGDLRRVRERGNERGAVRGEPQGDPGRPDEDARVRALTADDPQGIEYVYRSFQSTGRRSPTG